MLVVRGVDGRLMGLRKIMLTDRQAKAVERLMRNGSSLEYIAEAIGVSRSTLQRRLNDQLPHFPKRGKSWMDVRPRALPAPDELLDQIQRLRRQ